ncbi:MAG: hypothetical protein ABFD75_03490 [Smithella sp.]
MLKLADVLDINDYISYPTDSTGGDVLKEIEKSGFRSTTPIMASSSADEPSIPIRELYPLASEIKPELSTALHLLEEGIEDINISIKMLMENDLISSDDAIQRFQALLPELFCCRNLGDGFGAIVNAIFHSLKNLNGIPASLEQLKVIQKITNRILTEPFISFEEAVDEIILFDTVELISESDHFKYVADLLIE